MLGKAALALGLVLVVVGVLGLVLGGDDDATTVVADEPDSTADGGTGAATDEDAGTTSSTSSTTSSTSSTTSTTTTTTSTTTTTTTTTTSTTTTTTTTTTAPTVSEESVEEFLAVLLGAFASGDATTLFDRMNQATLDRYGVDQCRTYAGTVAGQAQDLTLVSSTDVGDWEYVTDDVSTTVPGATAVDVVRTVSDVAIDQTLHWQRVDGRFTWFTDCGTPV